MAKSLRRTTVIGLALIAVTFGASSVVHAQQLPSRADAQQTAQSRARCPAAPHYTPPARTKFGISISTAGASFEDAVARSRRGFGSLPVIRVFDPSVPPANAWERRKSELTKHTRVVTSFRMPPAQVLSGRYDSQLLHFFRSAPKHHRIFWSYFHEAEPQIAAGAFSAAAYRAAWRHIGDLAGSTCRKNLFPTLIRTGWTAFPGSGRTVSDYYPGRRYISVMAWDPYNSANVRPSLYASPRSILQPVVAASRKMHKPWALAETGSAITPSDPTGARRAAWLKHLGAYAINHHAGWVSYFNSATSVDFRLLDRPSIRAWRALMHPRSS
jgi:hypothetical protein